MADIADLSGMDVFKPETYLIKMLEAGVHFGHQSRRWHPRISKYLWKDKDGVHIFDLMKTAECLQVACKAVQEHLKTGKTIAYVGTKRQAAPIVKAQAERAGVSYLISRWPGGLITNWKQVQKSIQRLRDIKEGLKTGKFKDYTKKERVLMEKESIRLERLFGGIEKLQKPPDALFIVDINREKTAIREAKNKGIPVFALVDSNANPDDVNYPIPGNDDAVRSLKMLIGLFTDCVAGVKNSSVAG